MLIGNLTRDPEMRYTPSGAAVCTFGIATNRYYVASDGQKKEETEFVNIVAWNKLGELCSQLLVKGRKVYMEGRMQTRSWETPDGQTKQKTEVVIDDMRILDAKKDYEGGGGEGYVPPVVEDKGIDVAEDAGVDKPDDGDKKKADKKSDKPKDKKDKKEDIEDVDLDDLPF